MFSGHENSKQKTYDKIDSLLISILKILYIDVHIDDKY